MLASLLVGSVAGLGLRHPMHQLLQGKGQAGRDMLDPHCRHGIMNTEMTVCCMKDCGECSDTSDLCDAGRIAEKGMDPNGRESTCCPSWMTKLPSCSSSMAPCAIPDDVRNPPGLDSLKAADRHAKDDCGEAEKVARDAHHLVTAYIKFEEQSLSTSAASTTECGKYGTLAQAAAACSNNDHCIAFSTTSEDKPDCLYIAGTELESLAGGSNALYMKREEQFTGKTYKLTPTGVFTECTVSCGGGTKEVKLACRTSGGVSVPLGMCSTQVAMNADSKPKTEAHCNPLPCDVPMLEFADFAKELEEQHLKELTTAAPVEISAGTTTSTTTGTTTTPGPWCPQGTVSDDVGCMVMPKGMGEYYYQWVVCAHALFVVQPAWHNYYFDWDAPYRTQRHNEWVFGTYSEWDDMAEMIEYSGGYYYFQPFERAMFVDYKCPEGRTTHRGEPAMFSSDLECPEEPHPDGWYYPCTSMTVNIYDDCACR